MQISESHQLDSGAESIVKKREIKWGCSNRIVNGRDACNSRHVNETTLEATYLAAFAEMVEDAEDVVAAVREGAALTMEVDTMARLTEVENEIISLQESVLAMHKAKQQMAIGATEYTASIAEAKERMAALEAERDTLQDTTTKYAGVKAWLNTFTAQTTKGDTMTILDGAVMKSLVERIIIRGADMEVVFKCGVSVTKAYIKK